MPELSLSAGMRNGDGSRDLDRCLSRGVGLSSRHGVLLRTWKYFYTFQKYFLCIKILYRSKISRHFIISTYLSQVELGEVGGLEGELHDVAVDVGLEVAAGAVAEQLPRAHLAQLAAQHQTRLLARVERVVVHAAANQGRALVSRDQR